MVTGPALHLKIFAILLRLRRWLIVLFSDVQSAFHAVKLCKADRDVCRFLLSYIDGSLRHMRFTVLPFGLNCSPYILNAIILHHLSKEPSSPILDELVNNIYVDDFTGGCDTLEIAKNIYNESKDIFAKGGLNLTKWMSNNTEMQNYMNVTSKEETNVLGNF